MLRWNNSLHHSLYSTKCRQNLRHETSYIVFNIKLFFTICICNKYGSSKE